MIPHPHQQGSGPSARQDLGSSEFSGPAREIARCTLVIDTLVLIADRAKRLHDYPLANAIFVYIVSEFGPEIRGQIHHERGPRALGLLGLRDVAGRLFAIDQGRRYLCIRAGLLSPELRKRILDEGVVQRERYRHRRRHLPRTSEGQSKLIDDLRGCFPSPGEQRRFLDVARAGLTRSAFKPDSSLLGKLAGASA